MAWLGTWAYRKKIKVGGSIIPTDLSNFPVMLKICDASGRNGHDLSGVFTELGANSKKLAVTLADGVTQCPVEIEFWSNGTDEAVLHFLAPSLSASYNNYFYLYYDATQSDNTTYVGDTGDAVAQSVWADYEFVLHFGQAPTGSILDSTANGYDFTANGSMIAGDLAIEDGLQGINFDGTDDYLYNGTGPDPTGWEDYSVEAFFKLGSLPGAGDRVTLCTAHRTGDNNGSIELNLEASALNWNEIRHYADAAWNITRNEKGLPTVGVWNYSAGAWTIGERKLNLFNGQDAGNVVVNSIALDGGNGDWSVAAVNTYGHNLDGRFGELRVMNAKKADDWYVVTERTLRDELISWYADDTEESIVANWLGTWANRITYTIDGSLVDGSLTDFPVTIQANNTAGAGDTDITDFFDKLAYALTGDDFTGTDDDAPNTDLWVQSASTHSHNIQSNKLNFDPAAGTYHGYATSTFKVSGDFDIQIDWDYTTLQQPGSSVNTAARLLVRPLNTSYSTYGYIQRSYSSGGTNAHGVYSTGGTNTNKATTDSSGKYRVTRVSGVIKVFYWSGSQWEWNGSTAGLQIFAANTDDMHVELYSGQITGSTVVSNIDNFVINSGTVVWPQGTHPYRKRIAVTDQDGITQLPVEISFVDFANEKAAFHAKVPSIASGANKKLYLYYDPAQSDNAMVGDTGDAIAQSVWDSDFVAVYHLSQDPSGGADCILDSTANGNDGTPNGCTASGDLVLSSLNDYVIDFDGTDDYINCQSGAVLDDITYLTIEALINARNSGESSGGRVLQKSLVNAGWQMFLDGGYGGLGLIRDSSGGVGQWHAGTLTMDGSTWHSLAISHDESSINNDPLIYIDGASQTVTEDTTPSGSWVSEAGYDMWIGARSNSGADREIDANVGEIRVSKAIRSAAWLKATNHTLKGTLCTVSTPQALSAQETFNWLANSSDVPWGYRIPIITDHTKIDENLSDFPLAVRLSDSAGISGMDATHFFNEMDILSGVAGDTFTGSDGDSPSAALWRDWSIDNGSTRLTRIYGNKLRLATAATTGFQYARFNPEISGDFDIQVDWDFVTDPGSERNEFYLNVYSNSDSTYWLRLGYQPKDNAWKTSYQAGGSATYSLGTVEALSAGASRKFRLVRVGSVISAYRYTSGGAWALEDSQTITADDVIVQLVNYSWADTPTCTVDYDNFVINSGSILWPVSEYGLGKRVAFTLADGTTQLYAELDYISISGKEAVYHVKVPSISSVVDTVIYMYYDADMDENTTYIGDVYDGSSVWDADFAAVFHFEQIPVSGVYSILDSTGVNALWPLNMDPTNLVAGSLGHGCDFEAGDTDYMIASGAITVRGLAEFTIEAMYKPEAAPSVLGYIYSEMTDNANWTRCGLYQNADGTFTFGVRPSTTGTWYSADSAAIANSVWAHIAGVYDSDNDDLALLINGVREDTDSASKAAVPDVASARDRHIGRWNGGTPNYYLDGVLDELRISTIIRTDEWLKATNYALKDELNYLSAVEAWLKAYDKRIRVVVDSSKIDADLTNFPLTILLDSTNAAQLFTELATGGGPYANNAHPNRKKIRVATLGGESLNTELDTDDIENDEMVLHTKVPLIAADHDTVLFVYFDNTADDAPEVGDVNSAAGAAVWDSAFKAVYHFSDYSVTDSTENDEDGTISTGGSTAYNSPVGKAVYLDGVNDYMRLTGTALRDLLAAKSTGFTIEFFGLADPGDDGGMLVNIMANTYADEIRFYFINTDISFIWDDDPTAVTAQIVGDYRGTEYQYITAKVDASDVVLRLNYDEDTDTADVSGSGDLSVANNVAFGERYATSNGHQAASNWAYFRGYFDELRFSEGARSDAWLRATYEALNANLLSFAYETATPPVSLVVNIAVSGSWEQSTAVKIAISGAWKTVNAIKIAIGGAWKELAT